MSEYIGSEVKLAGDCIGDETAAMIEAMDEGQLIILENTRFYKEEEKNEAGFVEKLAAPFDLFVNDAFGTAHRDHASTVGVTKFLSPSVSGFLLAKVRKGVARAVAVAVSHAARRLPHVLTQPLSLPPIPAAAAPRVADLMAFCAGLTSTGLALSPDSFPPLVIHRIVR